MKNWLQYLPNIAWPKALTIAMVMGAAALAAVLATPTLVSVEHAPSLEQTVPKVFGDWRELPSPFIQVGVSTGEETSIDQPYDQTVMRTYVNAQGQQVHLALAWGRRQRQEVKIHRPDLCYVAQGWRVLALKSQTMSDIQHGPPQLTGKRMLTSVGGGYEAVSYWMRIGTLFSEDAFETRAHIFKQGLQGRIPDGILVRASMRVRTEADAAQGWEVSERFLSDLMKHLQPQTAALLVGPVALSTKG